MAHGEKNPAGLENTGEKGSVRFAIPSSQENNAKHND
ncbi:hypothetical protein CD31A_0195 [Corynebacterium diphtheriae 31A]|nr:hypothetical protein CD31A_0195 [Corynebacterium diphtheriae 31A]